MPPYQNESLHDMHALIQQLDTLNAGHAPEQWSMPDLGITKTLTGAKKAVEDKYNTKVKGQDLTKEGYWAQLQIPQKTIVLQNTFYDIIQDMQAWKPEEVDAFKNFIHGNAKTKLLLQANMEETPALKLEAVYALQALKPTEAGK
jgi:hypothetical protein